VKLIVRYRLFFRFRRVLFVQPRLVVRLFLGVLLFLDLGGKRLRIGELRLLFGVELGISGQVSSLIYTVIHLEK